MTAKKDKTDYGSVLPEQFHLTSKAEFAKGQLVKSLAGRDKDQYYLVVGRAGDLLYLADGRGRKLANPKKKNIRHVQKSKRIAADLLAFSTGGKLTDEDVRAGVKACLGK